jgi:ribA/ribD-fused uncharacterized protein
MPIIQFHSKSKKTEPPFTPSAMKDLSNFSDHDVMYEGYRYPSVEHAFQALKYSCTGRPELVDIVRENFANKTAVEAKSSGGKGAMKKWKVELDIGCWERKKVAIMKALIASKIERHPEIKQIINTAKMNNMELVHFSRSDMYWGAHVNEEGTAIKNGQNMLGKLYMTYYTELSSPMSSSSSSYSSSSSSSSSPSPSTSSSSSTSPPPPPPPVASTKGCPPDKILNPATGRCVSRTAKLGKSILQNQTRKASPKKASPKNVSIKACPPDKIVNPATGRCVSRTAKIGRSILAAVI